MVMFTRANDQNLIPPTTIGRERASIGQVTA